MRAVAFRAIAPATLAVGSGIKGNGGSFTLSRGRRMALAMRVLDCTDVSACVVRLAVDIDAESMGPGAAARDGAAPGA